MEPGKDHLLALLSKHDVTFFIPPYQRNYEWDEEQCSVFLDDIQKTARINMTGERSEHFFGTITYFSSKHVFNRPDKLVLIDGQQRITTTMLFLVAMRDMLDDPSSKATIDADYLKNDRVNDESEYKIKLKQVESDWEAYCDIILGRNLSERSKNSAVNKNYQYFKRNLQKIKEDGTIPLLALLDQGLFQFSVVTLELDPDHNKWENPQEIFESMNSLGKPLSFADLVRNYILLGKSAEVQDMLYKKYWMQLEELLPKQTSNFIRDYMQLKKASDCKQSSEKNSKILYSEFKNIFGSVEAEDLLRDMSSYAKNYAEIVLGLSTGNADLDQKLADLRVVGVSPSYSFMMALLYSWTNHKFTDAEIENIIDSIKIYFIRRRIVGLSNAENKRMPALVKQVSDIEAAADKRKTMFALLSKMENSMRLPNDTELSQIMENMNFYNFRYCKFLLALVEEKITKARPDIKDNNLQVEHIMPQSLDKGDDTANKIAWRHELGDNNWQDTLLKYVNNIGNLTLIRHNQELYDKPFAKKKDIYENKAGLQIAKTEIINQTNWNEASIINRQKWIINYILENVLPIPDEMRRTNNFAVDGSRLSFLALQLIGKDITYINDPSITARVTGDKEVEYEGKTWTLSVLTRELETRRGSVTPSGSYQGARYWSFAGIRLLDVI